MKNASVEMLTKVEEFLLDENYVLNIFQTVWIAISGASLILCNLIITITVLYFKKFRSLSCRLIAITCITYTASASTGSLQIIIGLTDVSIQLNCNIFGILTASLFNFSKFITGIIIMDRFIYICHPFRYPRIVNKFTMVGYLLIGATMSCLMGLIPYFASDEGYKLHKDTLQCEGPNNMKNRMHDIITSTILIIIIVISFHKIGHTSLKMRRAEQMSVPSPSQSKQSQSSTNEAVDPIHKMECTRQRSQPVTRTFQVTETVPKEPKIAFEKSPTTITHNSNRKITFPWYTSNTIHPIVVTRENGLQYEVQGTKNQRKSTTQRPAKLMLVGEMSATPDMKENVGYQMKQTLRGSKSKSLGQLGSLMELKQDGLISNTLSHPVFHQDLAQPANHDNQSQSKRGSIDVNIKERKTDAGSNPTIEKDDNIVTEINASQEIPTDSQTSEGILSHEDTGFKLKSESLIKCHIFSLCLVFILPWLIPEVLILALRFAPINTEHKYLSIRIICILFYNIAKMLIPVTCAMTHRDLRLKIKKCFKQFKAHRNHSMNSTAQTEANVMPESMSFSQFLKSSHE